MSNGIVFVEGVFMDCSVDARIFHRMLQVPAIAPVLIKAVDDFAISPRTGKYVVTIQAQYCKEIKKLLDWWQNISSMPYDER